MTFYDQNCKPGTAKPGSSFDNSPRSGACGGVGNIRERTTLEEIIDRQADNHIHISSAHSKIISILAKLRGNALRSGEAGAGRNPDDGMLNGLSYALSQESLTIGELLADIEELEKLL